MYLTDSWIDNSLLLTKSDKNALIFETIWNISHIRKLWKRPRYVSEKYFHLSIFKFRENHELDKFSWENLSCLCWHYPDDTFGRTLFWWNSNIDEKALETTLQCLCFEISKLSGKCARKFFGNNWEVKRVYDHEREGGNCYMIPYRIRRRLLED